MAATIHQPRTPSEVNVRVSCAASITALVVAPSMVSEPARVRVAATASAVVFLKVRNWPAQSAAAGSVTACAPVEGSLISLFRSAVVRVMSPVAALTTVPALHGPVPWWSSV